MGSLARPPLGSVPFRSSVGRSVGRLASVSYCYVCLWSPFFFRSLRAARERQGSEREGLASSSILHGGASERNGILWKVRRTTERLRWRRQSCRRDVRHCIKLYFILMSTWIRVDCRSGCSSCDACKNAATYHDGGRKRREKSVSCAPVPLQWQVRQRRA